MEREGIEALARAGFYVDYKPQITKEELLETVAEYDALIVRSRTKVTRDVIEASKKLKVIGRAGVGLDNIDIQAAKEKGITVVNTPEVLTNAVAELTIGLMLTVARGIAEGHRYLKKGEWIKSKLLGTELRGKTLGIIGFGRIGKRLARLAHAFDMRILVYDVVKPEEKALEEVEAKLVDVDDLLSNSDFISLHIPATPENRHFIDIEKLKKMKSSAFLINTARGSIIKEEDLVKALKNGLIKGAALDVYEKEPPTNTELLSLENVVLTPHIGSQTKEAQVNAALTIADKVISLLKE
jgi:D-3-phosphoglycerate dehydrogenase